MTVDIWPFFLVLCILNSGAAVCFSLLFALGGGDDDDETVGDGGGAGDDGALEYSAAPPDLFLSFIVLMLGVGTQDLTPLDSPGTSPALAKVTSRFIEISSPRPRLRACKRAAERRLHCFF